MANRKPALARSGGFGRVSTDADYTIDLSQLIVQGCGRDAPLAIQADHQIAFVALGL